MDEYEPTMAGRAIEDFVDEHLSNWYVRFAAAVSGKESMSRIRSVLIKPCMNAWKQLCKLIAPVSPFFADSIFSNLNAVTGRYSDKSVHHTLFPVSDEALIDTDWKKGCNWHRMPLH